MATTLTPSPMVATASPQPSILATAPREMSHVAPSPWPMSAPSKIASAQKTSRTDR